MNKAWAGKVSLKGYRNTLQGTYGGKRVNMGSAGHQGR